MRKLIAWFKNLHLINRTYHRDMARLESRITSCFATTQDVLNLIKERTDVHCDLHYRGDDVVICIGRFRGRDFVSVYNLHSRDFEHTVQHLRDLNRSANIRKIDCVPVVHAVIAREFKL